MEEQSTKVYEFLYCSCIYESSYATISVHRTKKGAYQAMNRYLNQEHENWFNRRIKFGKDKSRYSMRSLDLKYESWRVGELDLLD